MINLKEIPAVEIDKNELYTIKLYCELYWNRNQFSKETVDKHWMGYDHIKRNPNESGIIGEWAFWKRYTGISLADFLQKRPRRRSDKGDGITSDGFTFDIKTKCWRYPIASVFDKDFFRADINAPDFQRAEMQGFAFVYYEIEKALCHMVGWIDRERVAPYLEYHPKGEDRGNGFTYPADTYHVPYSVLDPMLYLCSGGVEVIT